MINITRLPSGAILLQKDDAEIIIDASALPALPAVLSSLLDGGRIADRARLEGYEAGLIQGREQARIEHETALRIAARQAEDVIEALGVAVGGLASAA